MLAPLFALAGDMPLAAQLEVLAGVAEALCGTQLWARPDGRALSAFVEDLGADSLDTVELVMALEDEFECEIPDEEAEKIRTVQQAIDYVAAHLKKA